MKKLKELRSKSSTKKIAGYTVAFKNVSNGRVEASIDGDKLDTYANQAEAEKMAKEFLKQYKGKMK